MKDGSRLIGKIGNQTDGTLEFETTYAGTIKVKFDQISELHADEPVKLMVKNDELQEATSITRTESAILVTTETGDTPESLDRDSIAYINPESWRYGEGHKFTGRLNLALTLNSDGAGKATVYWFLVSLKKTAASVIRQRRTGWRQPSMIIFRLKNFIMASIQVSNMTNLPTWI